MTTIRPRDSVAKTTRNATAMPLKIRLWLGLGALFAPLIHMVARMAHRSQGVDPARFAERLGNASAPRPDGRLVWVHAASLGEINQMPAVLDQLAADGTQILVTTFSGSGAQWVAAELPDVIHQFLPLDTPKAVRKFLSHWSPDCAVFVESDLWPRLLSETHAQGIPMILVNARPSKSRDKNPKAQAALLAHFDAITCKSDTVRDGLSDIGLPVERLHSFGDLRAYGSPMPVDDTVLSTLRDQLAVRPVWIAASTHADDEDAVLDAHQEVLKHASNAILIWAPRHPKRASSIIAKATSMELAQRSRGAPITHNTQIYLADTLGELGIMFSLANTVFLGGSFGNEGGHNPYEPARFGCAVITGPNARNHADGFAALGATTVQNETALGQAVLDHLAMPKPQISLPDGPDPATQTAALILNTLRV